MKIAFIFPGQGSQYVGMGKSLYDHFDIIKDYYDKADKTLGYSLKNLMFEGPKEELTLTYNAQPAILTMSIAVLELVKSKIAIEPLVCMGHSVGEYSALVAAGAISFEEAVYAVRKRGEAMQAAVKPGEGTMAAIIGADELAIKQSLTQAQASVGGIAEIANYNSPEQIVIAGNVITVEKAMSLLHAKGAKLVKKLEVSAPFHSSLMSPAVPVMEKVLQDISFKNTKCPVIFNVDAQPHSLAEDMYPLLLKQIASSVRWTDTILYAIKHGVDTFIEMGPGNVLTMLVKRINQSVKFINVNDETTLERLYAAVQ
ncbi:MAG: ACP S-malonyltransferase [Deltaproteobacteria bacterium]|nr:ACP S-malonyltransferase [Deltaproteobacteria bacterium]MCL5793018.1 ACP S-malonyltransferase [Deltaproteobacteria bacterium]